MTMVLTGCCPPPSFFGRSHFVTSSPGSLDSLEATWGRLVYLTVSFVVGPFKFIEKVSLLHNDEMMR